MVLLRACSEERLFSRNMQAASLHVASCLWLEERKIRPNLVSLSCLCAVAPSIFHPSPPSPPLSCMCRGTSISPTHQGHRWV